VNEKYCSDIHLMDLFSDGWQLWLVKEGLTIFGWTMKYWLGFRQRIQLPPTSLVTWCVPVWNSM
jgi:hypothetical protein